MTDKRRTPARPDLAAEHLKAEVEASAYVKAAPRRVLKSNVALRRGPGHDSAIETELLFGETFDVYEDKSGWSWGQSKTDGYVGYVESAALGEVSGEATHRVTALRSYLQEAADLKSPVKALLSMGSPVSVLSEDGRYSKTPDGYLFTGHLSPLDHIVSDWVAVAESFMGAPYLWGGRTSLGLDCSALVQLALQQYGLDVPRDSDQQFAEIGEPLDGEDLQRGDLVFWKTHVTIMVDPTHMVHANATAMAVSVDELKSFAARIEAAEGPVIGYRRLK